MKERRRLVRHSFWILAILLIAVGPSAFAQTAPEATGEEAPGTDSGCLSLLPPLIAILLALIFRQVVPALFAGVWVGAWIVSGNPFTGLLRTIDRYVIDALADKDHVSIVIFSLMLGGMVGIMARSGGTLGPATGP